MLNYLYGQFNDKPSPLASPKYCCFSWHTQLSFKWAVTSLILCMLKRGDWRGSWDGAEPPPTIWDQHKSWLGLNWNERNRKFWSDLNWQHRLSSPLLFMVFLNSQIFSEMKQVTWYPSWRVHLANGSTHFSTFCELFHKPIGRLHYTAQRKLQRNTWK